MPFGPTSGSITTNANYAVPFTPEDTRPLVVTQFGGISTSTMSFPMPFDSSPMTLTPQFTGGVTISAILTDGENSFAGSGIGGSPDVQDYLLKPETVAPMTNTAIQNAFSGIFEFI